LASNFRDQTKIIIDVGERIGGKDGVASLLPSRNMLDSLDRVFFTLLEYSSFELADGAIVATSAIEHLLTKYGFPITNIFRVPIGTDLELFKEVDRLYARRVLGLTSEARIVTYVGGSLTLPQYFYFLLDVLGELNRPPDVKLMFLGARVPTVVRDFVDRMSLGHRVLLTGPVRLEKYPLYLSASDVLVLPLQNNPIDYWRWPNRLQEYMASGRPVVVSPVSEAAKIVKIEKCGLVAESFTPKAFASKVEYLLNHPREAERLGSNGRNAVEEKYNWSAICRTIENVYLTLKKR
jgi:glycosyltransferase involved in cell wall biosynthesis